MTNRQKADTTTEHDSFLLTGVQSHTCNTKKSNPFQSKCIAFTYKIYYIKNIPAELQPCILSTVVAVAILVLCVQGHPSVAVHVCMCFIMSWVEIHVVGMSSASNSVFIYIQFVAVLILQRLLECVWSGPQLFCIWSGHCQMHCSAEILWRSAEEREWRRGCVQTADVIIFHIIFLVLCVKCADFIGNGPLLYNMNSMFCTRFSKMSRFQDTQSWMQHRQFINIMNCNFKITVGTHQCPVVSSESNSFNAFAPVVRSVQSHYSPTGVASWGRPL